MLGVSVPGKGLVLFFSNPDNVFDKLHVIAAQLFPSRLAELIVSILTGVRLGGPILSDVEPGQSRRPSSRIDNHRERLRRTMHFLVNRLAAASTNCLIDSIMLVLHVSPR